MVFLILNVDGINFLSLIGVAFCVLMYVFHEVNLLEHRMTPEIIVPFSRKQILSCLLYLIFCKKKHEMYNTYINSVSSDLLQMFGLWKLGEDLSDR